MEIKISHNTRIYFVEQEIFFYEKIFEIFCLTIKN